MAGANWCETAEQIWTNLNGAGSVAAWKIQAPYDNLNGGTYTSPNVVERAWHIYLCGLDSGFNYYGGLGNDDEVKTSLATRRAVELLSSFMSTNMANDHTPPTVFKPQRFPWNPGAYTFGWFNIIPGNGNALKKMNSEFYVWTHAYDVNEITNIALKVRLDNDGVNTLANNQNETYAGGSDVGSWVTVAMTKRVLPQTAAALTTAADNGQIEYFDDAVSPEVADYYFAKIDDTAVSGFRGKLLDYYVEAYDGLGNVSKSDIQHVWVADDGLGGSTASFSSDPRNCAPLAVNFAAAGGPLDGVTPVYQQISFDNGTNWDSFAMSGGGNVWGYTNATVPSNATRAIVCFHNGSGTYDNNGGANWSTAIRDCNAAVFSNGVSIDPAYPAAGQTVTISYDPAGRALASATNVNVHYGYNGDNWTTPPGDAMALVGSYWTFSYEVPAGATSIVMCFNNGSTWDNNNAQNWTFAVDPYVAPVPDNVVITNPIAATSSVAYAVSNVAVQGTAGTNLTGDLSWTNSGTGASGTLTYAASWSRSMDLAVGSNRIGVSAAIAGGGVSTAVVTVVRAAYVPPPPDGVVITNPTTTVTVANAVSSYALQGTAGTNLTGSLAWTNALNAQGSGFLRTTYWTQTVALAVGTNLVTVSGVISGSEAGTATNAADSSANYGGGWSDGSNGGTGFGAWTLNTTSNSGHFIDTDGFGFWSHEGGNLAEAIRSFASPLATGQTFSVFMKNGWIWESGGSIGVALRDGSGTTIWELYFNGGDIFYNTPAGVTDIGWTDAGLDVVFTVTGTNSFSAEVHPLGGSARQYNGTFAGSIADFRAWSYNNGTLDGQNSNRDYFIDDLQITSPVAGSESNSTATVAIVREAAAESQPVILGISFEGGGGGLGFSLGSSVSGATYAIWSSATLFPSQDWQKVVGTESNADGGPIDLTITNGLLPTNFFRVGYDQN